MKLATLRYSTQRTTNGVVGPAYRRARHGRVSCLPPLPNPHRCRMLSSADIQCSRMHVRRLAERPEEERRGAEVARHPSAQANLTGPQRANPRFVHLLRHTRPSSWNQHHSEAHHKLHCPNCKLRTELVPWRLCTSSCEHFRTLSESRAGCFANDDPRRRSHLLYAVTLV